MQKKQNVVSYTFSPDACLIICLFSTLSPSSYHLFYLLPASWEPINQPKNTKEETKDHPGNLSIIGTYPVLVGFTGKLAFL